MMNNENNDTAGSSSWNSSQGLGFSVLQRHNKAFGHPGGDLVRNHLGRNRISLAADIYRRYHRNSSLVSKYDFPFVNFFSRASLRTPDGDGESLSQYTPLQRTDIKTPFKPDLGINYGTTNAKAHRYSNNTATEQNSSTLSNTSKPSTFEAVSNPLSHSSYPPASLSEQPIVRRKIGGIDDQPHLVSGTPLDKSISHAASQKLETQGLDQLNPSILLQKSTEKENKSKGAAQEKNTLPNQIGLKSRIPFAGINRKIIPSFEYFPKYSKVRGNTSGLPAYNHGGHAPDLIQRVIGRQVPKKFNSTSISESSVANVTPLASSYSDRNNNPVTNAGSGAVLMGSQPDATNESEITVRQSKISSANSRLGEFHTHRSVQRAISKQNGGRNELPIGNRLAPSFGFLSSLLAGHRKLAQPAGKISENSVAKFSSLEHDFPESKTGLLAAADSGTSMVNPKVVSGVRPDQISPENRPVDAIRSHSPVKRAINRKNSAFPPKKHEPHNNLAVGGTEVVRFADNGPESGKTLTFASPLNVVNRKFSLLSTKSASLTLENPVAKFNPLEQYHPDNKTPDNKTNLSPGQNSQVSVIDFKTVAMPQPHQIATDNSRPDETHFHPSVQRAVSRQLGALPTKKNGIPDYKLFQGKLAQFHHNERWAGKNLAFARPLNTVQRKLSLSSVLSRDVTPESPIVKSVLLKHNIPETKIPGLAGGADSSSSSIGHTTMAASQPVVQQEQISRENKHQGKSDSLASVQRAVERQNGILSQISTQTGIRDRHPDLKTTAIQNQNIASRIVSRKSDHAHRDSVARHSEAADLKFTSLPVVLPARANVFSNVAGNLTPGTSQPLSIGREESFYGDRAIDSAMHLPLVQPFGIQHKTAVSSEPATAGDIPGYLQRQNASNDSAMAVLAAPTGTGETVSTQTGRSESNSLSTDDVVDKVWRKLMRKLVSEQEKMGGSSRWSH